MSEKHGCVFAILDMLFGGEKHQTQSLNEYPYSLKASVLTKSEMEFYRHIRIICGRKYAPLSMVRIADVLCVTPGTKPWYPAFNKIAQKHLDFVICETETMTPILAIELDDSSHEQPKRKERDRFVNEALDAAGLPLLRIKVQRTYDTKKLASDIRLKIASDKSKS